MIKSCIICGDEYKSKPGRNRKYCSRRCYFSDREVLIGSNHPCWKGGFPKCLDCGKKLGNRMSKRCHPCAMKHEGRRRFKQPKLTCPVCEKEFHRKPANIHDITTCSRKCRGILLSNLQSGENSHLWKHGGCKRKYPNGWKTSISEAIRERDLYKCKICGIPQEECIKKLSVHHIDEDKDNVNPRNLVSLCQSCHMKLHFKKVIYEKNIS